MPAAFINVDLEVESSESLDHLCHDLVSAGAIVLYNDSIDNGFMATFEIEDEKSRNDSNSLIASFCRAINGLTEDAHSTWTRANRRVFDIGYESHLPEGAFSSDLTSEVIHQISKCGADLRITIYQRSTKE
jgi:hypothetical protein